MLIKTFIFLPRKKKFYMTSVIIFDFRDENNEKTIPENIIFPCESWKTKFPSISFKVSPRNFTRKTVYQKERQYIKKFIIDCHDIRLLQYICFLFGGFRGFMYLNASKSTKCSCFFILLKKTNGATYFNSFTFLRSTTS